MNDLPMRILFTNAFPICATEVVYEERHQRDFPFTGTSLRQLKNSSTS